MARTKVAVPRIATVFCLGMALIIPGLAWGADPIGRMSLSARVGVSGYDMSKINDGISDTNNRLSVIRPEWDVPGRIHNGFDFVADAAYDLSDALRFGILYANSSGSTSVDFLQAISVKPSSGMLIPRLFYRVPWRPMIDMSVRVFAGWVYLTGAETRVEHEVTSEGSERLEFIKIEGSGSGFVTGATSEYTLSDTFTLTLEAGYRRAKASFDSGSWRIDKLASPGAPSDVCEDLTNAECLLEESYLWGFMNEEREELGRGELPTVRKDLDTDFSGFQIQIGLRAYIF
jgi:hypothetical protein